MFNNDSKLKSNSDIRKNHGLKKALLSIVIGMSASVMI